MSTKPYLSDPSQALKTIKENAGLKVVRGHDLRCTFGAACEKLGFSDRQTKRMLGHAVAGGESVGRYTGPEWKDLTDRMARIEELTLSKAPSVHNTLRPKNAPRMHDPACQHCQGAVAAPLAASSNQQLIFRLSRHTTRQGVFAARLRNNEHEDEGHGVLGSALAKHLKGKFFDATDHEMDLLCYVCEHHSDGMVQGDPTVLTCWDADRLDLWRVSIVPKASYLGTAAARTDVVMSKANRRAQVWSDVYDARHDNNWP